MTAPVSSPTMIGRAVDLDDMSAALDDSLGGSPRGIVVAGEAGIGKSRLLDEFLAAVPSDALVVTGQCVDIGSVGTPFGSVRKALRGLVAALGPEKVADAAGYSVSALAAILPELGVEARPIAESSTDELIDAIGTTIESIATERALVFVLEDVHWADAATLALLKALPRLLTTGRVLVVLTVRSDDVDEGHPICPVLAEMERSRAVMRIDVRRLDRDQVAEQMRAILGADPLQQTVDRVYARSGGVPFFVEELVLLGDDELPTSLRGVLLTRYDTLEPGTRELLRVLAAGGAVVPDAVLAAVHDVPAEQLDHDLRAALTAYMVTATSDGYAFRHALVREALRDDLLPRESVRVHTRYAEALEATGTASAADVASHWIAARDASRALDASLAAMGEARQTLATVAIAEFGEQCLSLWDQVPDAAERAGRDRAALLLEVADAHWNSAEVERALQRCNDALAACDRADVVLRARALTLKGRVMTELGMLGSREILLEAVALLDEWHPEEVEQRARINVWVGALCSNDGDTAQAMTYMRRAVQLVGQVTPGATRASTEALLGRLLVLAGEVDEGFALFESGRRAEWGESTDRYRWVSAVTDVYLQLGRYDEVIDLVDDAVEASRISGRERMWGTAVAANAVQAMYERGEFEQADELLRHGRALGLSPMVDVFSQELLVQSLVWRDDAAGAEAEIEGKRELLGRFAETDAQSRVAQALIFGWSAFVLGDLGGAWDAVTAVPRAEIVGLPGAGMQALVLTAAVLTARRSRGGEPSEADAAAIIASIRATFDQLPDWDTVPRWRAVFEAEVTEAAGGSAGVGSDPAAWAAAAAAIDHPTIPVYVLPYVLLRQAQAEHAVGDRTSAGQTASRAVRAGEASGVVLFARLAREFSERAGLGIGRGARAGGGEGGVVADLTEREAQVLDLVAEGLSNGQIGERLFISTKTASVHVSAILRKLGVSSRTEAAVVAERSRSARSAHPAAGSVEGEN
ncbi:helix-turn-helix transcriptional regulator [Agromyces sp. NPDC055520]